MPAFLTLPGQPALSEFRRNRLLDHLRAIDPRVATLQAAYFYVIWSDAALADDDVLRLRALLDAGPAAGVSEGDQAVYVIPRLGTISPWASKATDIAHNCAMATVHRIERGVEYRVGARKAMFGGSAPFGAQQLTRLAGALHDRMTESAMTQVPDPAKMFASLPGKPMRRIGMLEHGRAALEEANRGLGLALSDDEIDYLFDAFREAGSRPDRRRADDVRAGQFRALSPQDLQRELDDRRRGAVDLAVRHDSRHPRGPAAGTIVAYADNAAIIEGAPGQAIRDRAPGATTACTAWSSS